MKRIAEFQKVSEKQFMEDVKNKFMAMNGWCTKVHDWHLKELYEAVKLPVRATKHSAGYDFFAPFDITLRPGQTVTVPTGIRVKIDEGWVLQIYPRSGLGFKFRMQLDNTVGVIDGDYYESANEGHIMIKITNDSKENVSFMIKAGQGFAQGIFHEYGITIDDNADGIRNGGFGSTTK